MSRLDIKIKAGTKIIVDYGDGMTITHETITDTDIDYLYDTLSRLEQIEPVDAENRAAAECPQPCDHLSQHDAREGRTCPEHPCTCAPADVEIRMQS